MSYAVTLVVLATLLRFSAGQSSRQSHECDVPQYCSFIEEKGLEQSTFYQCDRFNPPQNAKCFSCTYRDCFMDLPVYTSKRQCNYDCASSSAISQDEVRRRMNKYAVLWQCAETPGPDGRCKPCDSTTCDNGKVVWETKPECETFDACDYGAISGIGQNAALEENLLETGSGAGLSTEDELSNKTFTANFFDPSGPTEVPRVSFAPPIISTATSPLAERTATSTPQPETSTPEVETPPSPAVTEDLEQPSLPEKRNEERFLIVPFETDEATEDLFNDLGRSFEHTLIQDLIVLGATPETFSYLHRQRIFTRFNMLHLQDTTVLRSKLPVDQKQVVLAEKRLATQLEIFERRLFRRKLFFHDLRRYLAQQKAKKGRGERVVIEPSDEPVYDMIFGSGAHGSTEVRRENENSVSETGSGTLPQSSAEISEELAREMFMVFGQPMPRTITVVAVPESDERKLDSSRIPVQLGESHKTVIPFFFEREEKAKEDPDVSGERENDEAPLILPFDSGFSNFVPFSQPSTNVFSNRPEHSQASGVDDAKTNDQSSRVAVADPEKPHTADERLATFFGKETDRVESPETFGGRTAAENSRTRPFESGRTPPRSGQARSAACRRQPGHLVCAGTARRPQLVLRWMAVGRMCRTYSYRYCPGTPVIDDLSIRWKEECEELCL